MPSLEGLGPRFASNRPSSPRVRSFMSSLVNGYYCRNCADAELAKRGMDPAKPAREYSGGEVYVPPPPETHPQLGVNAPDSAGGSLGTRLDLHA